MRGFVIAIAVSVLGAAQAGKQLPLAGAISPALRTHLQSERFQIITSMRGLPLGVREKLQQMFGTTSLDIADPGQDFQRMQALAGTPLPLRRLVAAGCAADNHCLVYYERGGASITRRAVLLHWTPGETRVEWGGIAPAGYRSIEEVRTAIGSGKIPGGESGPW